MNGIWTRGAAAAITITLIVAALRGKTGGAREVGVQPLAQPGVMEWSGLQAAGFAPDANGGIGDSPMPFSLLPSPLPGPGNVTSSGAHALRDSSAPGVPVHMTRCANLESC